MKCSEVSDWNNQSVEHLELRFAKPVDLSRIKFQNLKEVYANGVIHFSSLSLTKVERVILHDLKTFGQVLKHST